MAEEQLAVREVSDHTLCALCMQPIKGIVIKFFRYGCQYNSCKECFTKILE